MPLEGQEDGAVDVRRHWSLKEGHHLAIQSANFCQPASSTATLSHLPARKQCCSNKNQQVTSEGSGDPWAEERRTDLYLVFQYVVHWSPLHCIIMRKWMLTWNLQNLFPGLYLHAIFLFGSVCVVYSDCTPEQLAAIMNCSKHERHTRNYDYMEGGDVRIRQLFSGTQWFLTIDDSGNINGTQDSTNCYSKHRSFCVDRKFIIGPTVYLNYRHLPKFMWIWLLRTWDMLLYSLSPSVITLLISHVSLLEQPKWQVKCSRWEIWWVKLQHRL